MNEEDRQIATLAEQQFGVFARRQASDAGLSDYAQTRRLMAGRWEQVFPGVFGLPGSTRTGRQKAMAAVLWSGESSAISHVTAARLLRIGSMAVDRVHLTVPYGCGLRTTELAIHHAPAFATTDVVVVDGIRCTSATRTIIDCASMMDDETLEDAFEQARRMGLTSVTALTRRADDLCGRGRPGSARVRRLLTVQNPDDRALESRLEVKLARLLRKSSLPPPERQFPIGRFRLDFAWRRLRVACECDGFEHHGARLAWKRDRRRLAAIEAARWRIVLVTWADVTREPSQTVERLALALGEAA
jgi:very-short-patch-repair endonuclease